MSLESEYLATFKNFNEAFYNLTGSHDPFNYNRAKEVHFSILLGFKWNKEFNGRDSTDKDGNPVELKSTTQKNIKGSYKGLSVYERYEDFIDYLCKKYPDNTVHYYSRYENGMNLVEAYRLENEIVLEILLNKLEKHWDENGDYIPSSNKDPRLGADVCMTEIKKYGTKVI